MEKSLTSTLKYALTSEKKLNIVAKIIKNKDIKKARNLLENMPNKSSKILLRVLNSAVANSKRSKWLSEDDFYVQRVDIGKWIKLRRIKFASRSRVNPYVKHRAFVRVVLGVKE